MLALFAQGNAKLLLEKRLGRVINSTFTSQPFDFSNDSGVRSELRSQRNISCMLFEINESKEIVDCWPCITTDLSMHGTSVFVTKECSENEKYIFALRHEREFVIVQAQCVRCASNHLGGFQAGFQFMELVDLKGFLAIKLLLEMLSSPEC